VLDRRLAGPPAETANSIGPPRPSAAHVVSSRPVATDITSFDEAVPFVQPAQSSPPPSESILTQALPQDLASCMNSPLQGPQLRARLRRRGDHRRGGSTGELTERGPWPGDLGHGEAQGEGTL
jgi:hypothetical protein